MSYPSRNIKNEYTRLRGIPFGSSRAYLGPNHLLCLRLRGTSDIARRFYYSDITGLRCQKTRKGRVTSALLLTAALLLILLIFIPGYTSEFGRLVASVTATIVIGLLLLNLGLGDTCTTYLHTVNHTERLPSLGRYRSAKKAMVQLHHKIVTVQGVAEIPEDGEANFSFVPAYPRAAEAVEQPTLQGSKLIEFVFYVSIILGLSYVVDYWYTLHWKNTIDMLLVTGMALLAPAAMVRSYRLECDQVVRVALGALLAYFGTAFPHMILLTILVGALDPANIERMFEISELSLTDGVGAYMMLGYHSLTTVLFIVCGPIGLSALRRGRDGKVRNQNAEDGPEALE
jgi:hypothetical protein